MQTIKYIKKLLNRHINAATDIQFNKMIKHQWGIMSKLGKFRKEVKHNY